MLRGSRRKRALSGKLKTQLIVSFTAITCMILIVLTALFYGYSSQMIINKARENATWQIKQLEHSIRGQLDNVDQVSRQILVSAYFSEGISIDGLSSAGNVNAVNQLYRYFSGLVSTHDYIDSILYFGEDGKIIGYHDASNLYANDAEKAHPFFRSELFENSRAAGQFTVSGGFSPGDFFTGARFSDRGIHYISLARGVRSMGAAAGTIVINIREDSLRETYHLESMGSAATSFLLDRQGTVISAADKRYLAHTAHLDRGDAGQYSLQIGGDSPINSSENQIIVHSFEAYPLTLAYVIPNSSLFDGVSQLRNLLLLLFFATAAASLVLCLFWIYRITQPLSALTLAMKNVGGGDFSQRLDIDNRNELGVLGHQFNMMSQNIQELIEANSAIEARRREFEIKALQNQLNPHFLYNTLNTIKWMAIVKNERSIGECVTELGNMLQPIFRAESPYWALSREVEYLRSYLRIMSYRMGGDIRLEVQIPAPLPETGILRFLLQPIVENAVIHANPFQEQEGCIRLEGRLEGEYLLLTLSDAGVGIGEAQLDRLRRLLDRNGEDPPSSPEREDKTGLGLVATQRRIRLEYGDDCGIAITSGPGRGTSVTARIRQAGKRLGDIQPPQ